VTATLTLGLDGPRLFDDAREPHDRGPASRERGPAPRDRGPAPRDRGPAGAEAPRHARTLDEVLVGTWDGLSSHHTVACPVCTGKMAPRYGSGAAPVGGRCQRCGSTLG
jgi:hypothetical protein